MVDINLIGDDKTGERSGEEERIDEFTHTSSMDTQELAFEERTETFDTTKTTGLVRKRGYSSIVSTFIIVGVIAILGVAIYYLMFKDSDSSTQTTLPKTLPESGVVEQSTEPEPEQTEPQVTEQSTPTVEESEPDITRSVEPEPQKPADIKRPAVSLPSLGEDLSPASNQYLSESRAAFQTVSAIFNRVPANLSATLLSYAARKLRVELVAASAGDAKDFAQRLNSDFGSGGLSVLSEQQVASNGQMMEKVLISGTVTKTVSSNSPGAGVDIYNLSQFKEWLQSASKQFGLELRQIDSQQGRFSEGYQKTPILLRIYGSKNSLLKFLDNLAQQNFNIELTKILMVSPDMVSFSDENLMLVMNLFLYQPS
jgi:hypothetical protein